MEFLAPITAAVAAAATVPLLVLLYFLKLRRREVWISSTLLWRRAVRDLQVNAPFQRLRRNLLLLLQLLALLAVLAALARPVAKLARGPGMRYVILIDRSGSMNATDADGGRLAEAKRRAKALVETLRRGAIFSLRDQSDQAMVIAFDRAAKVMCNFTSDKAQLAAAVDAVEPTDAPSRLGEAIAVARAYATSPGQDANNRSAEAAARLELFSDGRIGDLDDVVVQDGELNFHCIGESSGNVAVVAMQARRSYEKADEVSIFASLANFGAEEAACDVQLSIDGDVRAVRPVRIAPRSPGPDGGPDRPGNVSVSFSLSHSGAAVVEVRHLARDLLPADDAAWAILQPPRRLKALLVTTGNLALDAALAACPLARLDRMTPTEFDKTDPARLGAEAYDLIVLDNHVPKRLPRNQYLVFGRPPPGVGCQAGQKLGRQIAADWQSGHPVLQHVDLANLFVGSCTKLSLPRDAVVLAELNDTPGLAVVRRRGSVLVLVNFDLMQSNWPFEPGFAMFCYNAVNFLALESGQAGRSSLRVGQALAVQGAASDGRALVGGPGFAKRPVTPDASGMFRYPNTARAGVYAVSIPDRAPRLFAVNLLDAAESDIRPRREIVVSGQTVAARPAGAAANQEIWPYLAALALLIVCVEWVVYNLKVRL